MNLYPIMTPYEFKKSKKFIKKHKVCGVNVIYIVYTSAIGQSIHAKCSGCGKEKDITDYGCW